MRFPLFASTKLQHLILFLAFGVTSLANAADLAPAIAPKLASSPIAKTATVQPVNAKPLWITLTPQHKLTLAPLASEWDKMDEIHKKKWLEIANKYAAMKPDEQARVQERMHAWVKLTPEQRMQARENFARTKQIKPEQKSAQWQEYQQLSNEQKKQLASEASKKKSITNLPPESQRNVKPLAPIKTGPKPVSVASAQTIQVPQVNIAPASAAAQSSAK